MNKLAVYPRQMELFPLNTMPQKEDLRMFKSVALNITNFKQYKADAKLLKSLVIYFYNEVQNNIFNMRYIDPVYFGKLLGYSNNYLGKKHPNPAQLDGLKEEEIDTLRKLEKKDPKKHKIWDTVFENAMWLLLNRPLSVTYGEEYSKNNEKAYLSNKKVIHFLESIEIIFQPTTAKGKEKKIYFYQLAENFVDKTFTHYFNINLELFPDLRKHNTEDLYMFILNQKNSRFAKYYLNKNEIPKDTEFIKETIQIYFTLAKELSNVNEVVERQNKNRINLRMKKLKAQLDSKMQIDFEWDYTIDKQGKRSKNKYLLKITFWELTSKVIKEIEDYKNNDRSFKEKCFHQLFHEVFKKESPMIYNEGSIIGRAKIFSEWLNNDSADYQDKINAIKIAQLSTYKTEISTNRAITYLNSLKESGSLMSLQN